MQQRLPITIVRAGDQEGVRKMRDAFGGVGTTLRGEVADGRNAFAASRGARGQRKCGNAYGLYGT